MNKNLALSVAVTFALAGCGGNSEGISSASNSPALKMGGQRQAADVQSFSTSIQGFRTNFSISRNGDGTITLTDNIEKTAQIFPATTTTLQFLDAYTSFDTTGIESKVYRLYQAAFNRKPDTPGLGFWINWARSGLSFDEIASDFISSAEFQTMYGPNPDASSFVNSLYNNVLHRAGEKAGVEWWVGNVNNGVPRSGVLLGFSESAENQNNLLQSQLAGFDYIPYQPAAPIGVGTCEPSKYGAPVTQLLEYGVQNNMWNREIVKAPYTYTNCTYGAVIGTNTIAASWNWKLPPLDFVNITGAVKGYPNIDYGWNPQAAGAPSTNSILPMQNAKVADMIATFDQRAAVDKDAQYQTFFDIWYIKDAVPTKDFTNTTLELCLWVDYSEIYWLDKRYFIETVKCRFASKIDPLLPIICRRI